MSSKLSIIIPIYNERSTLHDIISKVRFSDLRGLQKEIILVDDGSADGTREMLQELKDPDLKIYFNERNLGKGGAVRHGFQKATGEILIIQDADLEYDPNDYYAVILPILEGKADAVMGIRFVAEADKKKHGLFYGLGNKVITLVNNLLYFNNAQEYTGGYKAFKKSIVDSISVNSNGFDYEHELICKVLKRGYKVATIPIHYSPRDYTEGKKINWRDGFKILWVIIKYRFVD